MYSAFSLVSNDFKNTRVIIFIFLFRNFCSRIFRLLGEIQTRISNSNQPTEAAEKGEEITTWPQPVLKWKIRLEVQFYRTRTMFNPSQRNPFVERESIVLKMAFPYFFLRNLFFSFWFASLAKPANKAYLLKWQLVNWIFFRERIGRFWRKWSTTNFLVGSKHLCDIFFSPIFLMSLLFRLDSKCVEHKIFF